MSTAGPPSAVDRAAAIVAAALITSIGALFFNVMPLLVGAVADQYGWDESRLGFFASSGLVGVTLTTLTAPVWVRRVRWRATVRVASAVGALGYLLMASLESYLAMLLCLSVVGLTIAIAYAPALAALSDTRDPARSFGIALLVQVCLGAGLSVSIPTLEVARGADGIFQALALLTALLVPISRWLPDRGARLEARPASGPSERAGPGIPLGLAGMLVFYVATTSVWGFLELIANHHAIADDQVASAIGLSLLVSGVGALAAAMTSERVPHRLGIAVGAAGLSLSCVALEIGASYRAFFAATIAFNFCWNFGLVHQLAFIARLDLTGRYTVLATAMQSVGGVLGPALAGLVATGDGFVPVLALGITFALASMALYLSVDVAGRRA